MRVLMITSEWPTPDYPTSGIFVSQQARFLRSAGVELDVYHFRGKKNPFRYFVYWKQVFAKILAANYDVVHAQFGQSGLLSLPKKHPLVITFHGSDLLGIISDKTGNYTIRGKILMRISQTMANLSDQVIAVSPEVGAKLPISDYHLVPSGIDFDLFKPIPKQEARKYLGWDTDAPIVLFGANPAVYRKRFHLAQEVVEKAKAYFSDIQLVYFQNTPHSDVPYYMNAADVLLMTSMHEGSPGVVKEALACNLPVVSVDVGDVRERISSIEGCVLCEDDNPETLAKGLIQVLNKRQRIDGRSHVKIFDEAYLASRVIEIYQEAIRIYKEKH